MKRKYQIRRLIAAILLVSLVTVFTSIVIKKSNELFVRALDAEFERQEAVLEEHFQTHGIGK